MESQRDNSTVFSLDQLRDIILPLSQRFGMRWARVFGSYARGEAQGSSDIDLLVDKGNRRFVDMFGLSGEVSELTGKNVDIYDVSELKPGPFRDTVLSEAVAL